MFRWIFYDVKQMLRNRKNIMTFIVLLIIHLLVLSYYSNDDDILANKIDEYSENEDWYLGYYFPNMPIDDEFIEEIKFKEKLLAAISDNNIKEYNRLIVIEELESANKIERYLLGLDDVEYASLKEKLDSYYRNQDLHQDLKEKIYEDFNYTDDSKTVSNDLSMYNSKVNHLQYKYEVYKKGFMHYDEPSKSSMTVTLTLFREYVMYFLVLVPIIVGFDAFSKDKKNGSIRSIMTLSQRRSKYLIVKISSALIVSLIILILPILIAVLVNNVSIINDLKYPSYLYAKGLSSLEAIKPVMEYQGNSYMLDQYSYHSRAVYNLDEYGFIIGVHKGVKLLSLGHMLAYSLVLASFFILFVLSVQLSLALNFNKTLAILVILLLTGGLFYLSLNMNLAVLKKSATSGLLEHSPKLIEKLNPLSYLRVVDVVEGTLPYTFLAGVITLSSYSFITIVVGILTLNKKDITY